MQAPAHAYYAALGSQADCCSVPPWISFSRSAAHSVQRPQPLPRPSSIASTSTVAAPSCAQRLISRSVIALQMQMYMRRRVDNENENHYRLFA